MEIDVDVRAAIEAPKADKVIRLEMPCTYPVRYTCEGGNMVEVVYAAEWPELIYRVSMNVLGRGYYDEAEGAVEAEIWFVGKPVLHVGRPYSEAYAEVRQK